MEQPAVSWYATTWISISMPIQVLFQLYFMMLGYEKWNVVTCVDIWIAWNNYLITLDR